MELTRKIYRQPVKDFYRVVPDLLSFSEPFSTMRPRQKDVYAELLKRSDRYRSYPVKEKGILIFNGEVYKEIADKLEVSKDVVANVISELRIKDILIRDEAGVEMVNPVYDIAKVDIIGFNFIEEC